VHRLLDPGHVQRDEMSGPTDRDWATVIDKAAQASANEIAVSGTLTGRVGGRDHDNKPTNGIWRVEPSRLLQWEATLDGQKIIGGGRFLSTGFQLPWAIRCEG
jgi:hypothetical protein